MRRPVPAESRAGHSAGRRQGQGRGPEGLLRRLRRGFPGEAQLEPAGTWKGGWREYEDTLPMPTAMVHSEPRSKKGLGIAQSNKPSFYHSLGPTLGRGFPRL